MNKFNAFTVISVFGASAGTILLSQPKIDEIYQMNCASCHGAEMEGGMAPSMLDDEWRYGGD